MNLCTSVTNWNDEGRVHRLRHKVANDLVWIYSKHVGFPSELTGTKRRHFFRFNLVSSPENLNKKLRRNLPPREEKNPRSNLHFECWWRFARSRNQLYRTRQRRIKRKKNILAEGYENKSFRWECFSSAVFLFSVLAHGDNNICASCFLLSSPVKEMKVPFRRRAAHDEWISHTLSGTFDCFVCLPELWTSPSPTRSEVDPTYCQCQRVLLVDASNCWLHKARRLSAHRTFLPTDIVWLSLVWWLYGAGVENLASR